MMDYAEFRLAVPIWDLSDEAGDDDSSDIKSLFELLGIARPGMPLTDKYWSYYDYSAAMYQGDPSARIGRGDLVMFLSDKDGEAFIAIDTFDEATDQMNMVSIGVRVRGEQAQEVGRLLQSIRSSAEVASARTATLD